MKASDVRFSGSIPALYHLCLGPLLFEPYAEDLSRRAVAAGPRRILETAAGTGIVTAALRRALPEAEIVATDLNPAMLEEAAVRVGAEVAVWREADAQDLPFASESFDAVLCQFGAMFFPDRAAAYREARRVLRPGGTFLFNVWDRLEANPVAAACAEAVAALFPGDPPAFLSRVPFGYHDRAAIEAELRAAGFAEVSSETVARASVVVPEEAARGFCLGSPLRSEIEERAPDRLEEAVEAAAAAVARLPFDGEGRAPLSAHFFTAVA